VRQRVDRMVALSGSIAEAIGADKGQAERAALLAKCDLVSQMVFEFPEVQGIMGGYFARNDGEADAIANAVESHYQPAGPDDDCPTDKVAVCVAMAEKLDTLAGFFAIDEKPTGSKDPFALRRAALGIIRLILENDLRVNLRNLLFDALMLHHKDGNIGISDAEAMSMHNREPGDGIPSSTELLAFFEDRLKVYLRADGIRHDLIAACFAVKGDDDLWFQVEKTKALATFLDSEDGNDLYSGYKRSTNFLVKEEAKDNSKFSGAVVVDLLVEAEEKELATILEANSAANLGLMHKAMTADTDHVSVALTGLMLNVAELRKPVDAFLDKVHVNVEDQELRRNRLNLMAMIRNTLNQVADFSQIEG